MTTFWARTMVINTALNQNISKECATYFDVLLQEHGYKITEINNVNDAIQMTSNGQNLQFTSTVIVKNEFEDVKDALISMGLKDNEFDLMQYIRTTKFNDTLNHFQRVDRYLSEILHHDIDEIPSIMLKYLQDNKDTLTLEEIYEIDDYRCHCKFDNYSSEQSQKLREVFQYIEKLVDKRHKKQSLEL